MLLSLSSVIAGLAICELVVRVAGPSLPGSFSTRALQERHPSYGVFHRPGAAAWVRDPEFTTYVRFNRDGLRGDEVRQRSPGVLRVLMIGDSFVEGAEVAEEATVTSVVARSLEAGGTPAEVLNAGVRGWGTAQEYLYLTNQGLSLQPDVVVLVVYVGNDLVDNSLELSATAPGGTVLRPFFTLDSGALVPIPVQFPPAPRFASLLETARTRSALFNLVETGVADKLAYAEQAEVHRSVHRMVFADPPPPAWERAWSVTDALLVAMRDVTEAAGRRFLLVLAPHNAQLDAREFTALVRGSMPNGVQWDPTLPQRRLLALAARRGIATVDLLPDFQMAQAAGPAADPLFFAKNSHWTPAGHGVVAEAIARALAGNGILAQP